MAKPPAPRSRPAIVFPDADLDRAIPGTAMGIFFNQGQTCCAGSRLFAHKKVFDQMVEGMSNVAKSIKLGPGLDPELRWVRWCWKSSSRA